VGPVVGPELESSEQPTMPATIRLVSVAPLSERLTMEFNISTSRRMGNRNRPAPRNVVRTRVR
jgi:hypothetical protein